MIKYLAITLLAISVITNLGAQNSYTISGSIKDAKTGEDLPFVTVQLKSNLSIGATSNIYGFYSLTVPSISDTLVVSSLGYQKLYKAYNIANSTIINLELSPSAEQLKELVITAESESENLSRNEGSVTKINIKTVKELPSLGGEPDIVNIAQMSPGVKTAGEGNSGYYVRGGGLDQNLVLLDEAPVYNPSHVLGIFSVFNSDAIKDATMYKGGMMPEYGGKTASVMDVRMNDGNMKEFKTSGGIGLIASRLTFEGPIVKDKGSFLISGRRSFLEPYLAIAPQENVNQSNMYFYDVNLKANYKINDKNRVFLSGYFGKDNFGFADRFAMNWGNATTTLRWNHIFSNKLFSNTSLIYSKYNYGLDVSSNSQENRLSSSIEDFNLKQDFSYYLNDKNSLKFGVNVIHHTIEPQRNTGRAVNPEFNFKGLESALFIQNSMKVTSNLDLNYGVRLSLFNRLGDGTSSQYNESGQAVETTTFSSGEIMKTYFNVEPRLSAAYALNKKSSVKLNYNRNAQYLHQLTSSTSSTPLDVWVMSSENIKPQLADQIALGYFRNLKNNHYEASVEGYYKYMQNTIDYRTGSNTFLSTDVESDLVYGIGESYGLEFTLKKIKGKLTGWLGYTISKTTRQYDEIDNGEKFSARQDRTHDINLVAMYKLNKKLTLSTGFTYYTGDAVTFPTGQYVENGVTIPVYSSRNGYRMPDYHRLDLGLIWYLKQTEKIESNLNFSLYNVYGRENAYSIEFRPNEDNPNEMEVVQTSLFRWVPSVTYNFKF